MKISQRSKAIITSYEKGYRVIEGFPYNPAGKELSTHLWKANIKSPYKQITVNCDKKNVVIPIHRMVAYQKYGMEMFKLNVVVRHKDGDSLNNSDDNIILGTYEDNYYDIPEEVRKLNSIKGGITYKYRKRIGYIRPINTEWKDRVKKYESIEEKVKELGTKYGLSIRARAIITAYDKGYRILDGRVYNPIGKELKASIQDYEGRKQKNIKITSEKRCCIVPIHKLVAYQKYGIDALLPKIVVRHKDGNSLNNLEDNILIGTHQDNMFDISPEKRSEKSKKAWITRRKNPNYNRGGRKRKYNIPQDIIDSMLQDKVTGMKCITISKKYGLNYNLVYNTLKKCGV